jgi:hypothetical protein
VGCFHRHLKAVRHVARYTQDLGSKDPGRRSIQEVVRYIDARKDRWGVEPICRALQFAPATLNATKTRPPSARQVRDDTLKSEILRVHQSNNDGTYGAKKVWKQVEFVSLVGMQAHRERIPPNSWGLTDNMKIVDSGSLPRGVCGF